MEGKRKRAEGGQVGATGGAGGRRRKERDVEVKEEAVAAPAEEEVEEFFAILRRMHVAVKYFEKSNVNGNGDGRQLTGRCGTALDDEVLVGVDGFKAREDVQAGEDVVVGVCKNGVLDLNAVPEPENNSV